MNSYLHLQAHLHLLQHQTRKVSLPHASITLLLPEHDVPSEAKYCFVAQTSRAFPPPKTVHIPQIDSTRVARYHHHAPGQQMQPRGLQLSVTQIHHYNRYAHQSGSHAPKPRQLPTHSYTLAHCPWLYEISPALLEQVVV